MSPAGPRFSVITPVYDPPRPVLEAAIASVEAQRYDDWELILVDDCSLSPHVREVLEAAAARDPRIRTRYRSVNGGIVAASNDAIEVARGEFLALLDNDDELHPDALAHVAAAIDDAGPDEVDFVYTDEDLIDEQGRHRDPFYKPGWSPERFRCQMYTCHLGVYRRSVVEEVGRFRADFVGSQDFDLVFRVSERARAIVHVPEVLYHWRTLPTSAAGNVDAKPYAWVNGRRAIQDHCDRTGVEAIVEDEMVAPGIYRLRPVLRDEPLVSIVIPTAGTRREVRGQEVILAEQCIRSIIERSTYDRYELVAVIDDHADTHARAAIEQAGGDRLRMVPYHKPFNFSDKCNLGVVSSNGEHVLLLNDDTEVIAPDWLQSLLMYSRIEDVGAVGARLLYGDGRLQHVGVGLSLCDEGVAPGHIARGWAGDSLAWRGAFRLPCNYLVVTGACLMSRREVYDKVGGLSVDFPLSYNDVDYCLKLIEAGYRVAYDPNAELYHHESASRDPNVGREEARRLADRWARSFAGDPYLNPNFDPYSVDVLTPPYDSAGTAYPVRQLPTDGQRPRRSPALGGTRKRPSTGSERNPSAPL